MGKRKLEDNFTCTHCKRKYWLHEECHGINFRTYSKRHVDQGKGYCTSCYDYVVLGL